MKEILLAGRRAALCMAVGLAWMPPTLAKSAPGLEPSWAEFQAICRAERAAAGRYRIPPPEVGVIDYFPVLALQAGQSRFSFDRFVLALRKAATKEGARLNKGGSRWILPHDKGQALYPADRIVQTIYYRGKLYIIDGHHRALASTYLGAATIPVHIVDDWSRRYSRAEFHRQMEAMNYARWRSPYGRAVRLRDLCDLIDDPNLLLARFIIHKIDVEFELGRFRIKSIRQMPRAIALKINQDLPFFEFELADALRRGGVAFDPRRDPADISEAELQEYLEILRAASAEPWSNLDRVLLLDRPSDLESLDLKPLVFQHLQRISCHELL